MEANFSATAETGVDSAKNGDFDSFFENEILSHVDNVNTWLTQYVRFSYNKDDINELLAEGNVDWNHEKKLYLKLKMQERLKSDFLKIRSWCLLTQMETETLRIMQRHKILKLIPTRFPKKKAGWLILKAEKTLCR